MSASHVLAALAAYSEVASSSLLRLVAIFVLAATSRADSRLLSPSTWGCRGAPVACRHRTRSALVVSCTRR
jgi:hypothetical protein